MEIPKFPELTSMKGPTSDRLRGAELPSVTTVMKPLSSEVYGGVDEWVMERPPAVGQQYTTPSRTGRCTASRILPRSTGVILTAFGLGPGHEADGAR